MVKIYGESGASFSSMAAYVSLEDYESLRAALREALDGWIDWCKAYEYNDAGLGLSERDERRIAELRAQFLDDK